TGLAAQDPVGRAAAGIRAEELRAYLDTLAGDAMAGRATPSPGLEAAAAYVAGRFRAWGLRPAGDSGSYVQRYQARTVRVIPAARRLSALWRDGHRTWTPGEDYFTFPAQAGAAGAPAAFVGNAAVGADLTGFPAGHVAVFHLPGDPMQNVSSLAAGLTAALRASAAGVVMVLSPGVDRDSLDWFAGQMEDANVVLPVPLAVMGWDAGAALLRAGGLDPATIAGAPVGGWRVLDGVEMVIESPFRASFSAAPNVVAVLRGSDPALRDEHVVVTAHLDHVGTAHPDAAGDSIYNGADDNASGVAAMLEAARALASLPSAPRRSIVFVAPSGEESGLQGSFHWAAHPPVPRGRLVANLNLDMVGRNAPDTLYVLGQEYSSLGAVVRRVAAQHPELRFSYPAHPDPGLGWFGRSDHVAFVHAGVPVLFLSTLPHPDYHRPSDEPGTIDVEKLARVARFLVYVADAVAGAPERPRWTATGQAEATRATQ
ncbi:MAG TPA: M28 family peptidase, partial [Longimicrobiaceae bacterium]|nr:M28 family peptidase [Longimicrobiaceae bacterium]